MKTWRISRNSGEGWNLDWGWRRGAWACGTGALLLDLRVLVRLVAGQPDAPGLTLLLGLHGLALLGFFPCFLWLMPLNYRVHKGLACLLAFGVGGALPLAGPLLLAGLVLIVRRPACVPHPERDYHVGDGHPRNRPEYGAPGGTTARTILEVLNRADGEARRRAILVLRHLDPKLALPLLRKGLLDSDDRVRLFSQGLYLKVVHGLDEPVRQLTARLSRQPESLKLQLRLAELLHESVYLEVAPEEGLKATLHKAMALLEQVIAADARNPRAHWLLLKCALKDRDRGKARRSLDALRALGEPAGLTRPWEFELAFLDRDWARFRALLSAAPPRQLNGPGWREWRAFWTGEPAVKP